MHTAGYRALDLPFCYVAFAVRDLVGALRGMRALGIRGFGVSMPYKLEVVALCDAVDDVAAQIGAVNTVVNDDGRLVGHNTDWQGALAALERVCPPRGARVLVLGAGGAARAVCFGLVHAGARVTLSNRSDERARALAVDVGGDVDVRPWAERERGTFDAIVNASSLGMTDVDPSSPLERIGAPVVMDIVYKPIETALVARARAAGARVVHGGHMLLHQAARQFELYTGHAAPLEAMERALLAAVAASP